jgi:quinol monooxygenase YgiN
MIVLIARCQIDPAALPQLRPMIDQTMRLTWEESGCLSYSIAVESEAEGVVTIVERWENEKALTDYLATPAMLDFHDAVQASLIAIDARIYDVTGERPLPTPPARKPVLSIVYGANGISAA